MKRKFTNPLYRLMSLIFIVTLLFGSTAWASVPAAPSNLTATAVSTSQINLSWIDNATDESYYRIERSANGVDNWYMFSAANANATTYSVTGLSAGTTYYYRVRAEKVRVGVSDPSNAASATTFSSSGRLAATTSSVVAAPSNLTATAVSTSQINLSWTDNATNESYYRIERSTNGVDNWYMFSATNANATTYSVTGLSAGTTYYYRVRAEQVRVALSDPSNVASATTFSSARAIASLPENANEAVSISTWPNPASDKVVVQVDAYWKKDGTISLHDADGRILVKDKIASDEHTFDVSNLPAGMYIIQLSNSTKRNTHKIFVR